MPLGTLNHTPEAPTILLSLNTTYNMGKKALVFESGMAVGNQGQGGERRAGSCCGSSPGCGVGAGAAVAACPHTYYGLLHISPTDSALRACLPAPLSLTRAPALAPLQVPTLSTEKGQYMTKLNLDLINSLLCTYVIKHIHTHIILDFN